jgi:hypothetical protein
MVTQANKHHRSTRTFKTSTFQHCAYINGSEASPQQRHTVNSSILCFQLFAHHTEQQNGHNQQSRAWAQVVHARTSGRGKNHPVIRLGVARFKGQVQEGFPKVPGRLSVE